MKAKTYKTSTSPRDKPLSNRRQPMNDFFIEIISSNEQQEENPEFIDVLISQVEPKYCSELLKELAQVLPLEAMKPGRTCNGEYIKNSRMKTRVNLSHLRRVRRCHYSETNKGSLSFPLQQKQVPHEVVPGLNESAPSLKDSTATNKKRRTDGNEPYILEVLLGEVSDVKDVPSAILESLKSNYNLVLEQLTVPGRRPTASGAITCTLASQSLPDTKNPVNDNFSLNTSWPLVNQPTKDDSSKANLSLSSIMEEEHEELQRMMDGMKEAIRDAHTLKQKHYITANGEKHACSINLHVGGSGGSGAVIMCSKTNRILSTATKELAEQLQMLHQEENGWVTLKNPLITPVILAIQGISRLERQTAHNEGSLTSETFRNGQYLCTGISRVIYGVPRINGGGYGGGILDGITSNSNDGNTGEPPVYIHNLPGINHHYRVFCCNPKSDLYRECTKLHPF